MRDKSILVYGLDYNWGGKESIILSFLKILSSKYRIDIILEKEPFYLDKLDKLDINIIYLPHARKRPLIFINELKKILKYNNYNYIWMNIGAWGIQSVSFLEIAKKFSNSKIIIHSHGSNIHTDKVIRNFALRIFHHISKYFVVNDRVIKWACSQTAGLWMYGNRKKFKVINNAINIKNYIFSQSIRDNYRKKLNIFNEFVIINVGRLEKVKNQEFLIDVFSRFSKVYPNSVLLLVGDGSLKNMLIDKVKLLNLTEKIKFLGMREDVAELFSASDAFCLPSLSEGLPLVGIEALTSGLQCLVSDQVTRELNISNNISFIPILEKNISNWVDKLYEVSAMDIDRSNAYIDVVKAQYGLEQVAVDIDKFLDEYDIKNES